MENEDEVKNRFIEIRRKFGPTQAKFGRVIGVSDVTISKIESGIIKINEKHIKLICGTLGINENWLKTGAGKMFDTAKDPKLEQIIRSFNKLDPLLQDYVMKYLDWLVDYYAQKPE